MTAGARLVATGCEVVSMGGTVGLRIGERLGVAVAACGEDVGKKAEVDDCGALLGCEMGFKLEFLLLAVALLEAV